MKHRYSDQYTSSPALVLPIQVSVSASSPRHKCVAKIDTGADMCVLPQELIERMHLTRYATRRAHPVGDKAFESSSYLVHVHLEQRVFAIEAIAHRRKYMLLGRDILNDLILHADGPKEEFWFEFR